MNLLPQEIEPFLDYVFTTLARKPKRLKLHETASIARYLEAVAWELPFGRERSELEYLVATIWRAISRFGQIKLPEKQDVIRFLQEHEHTYLNSFRIDKIVKFTDSRPQPTGYKASFQPSTLMGMYRSRSGRGPARLQDDLTERIYIAYHALRRTKQRNARGRIAATLNRFGLTTGARSGTSITWGPYEVSERVKQFQDRLNRQLRKGPSKAELGTVIEQRRDRLVDGWISEFRRSLPGLRRER